MLEQIERDDENLIREAMKSHKDGFKATKQIFVVVYNQDYSLTRKNKGYEAFKDIDEVVNDFKDVQLGWKILHGFSDSEMIIRHDADKSCFK